MSLELEDVPGVGAKTADALESLDDPRDAIEREDVATLASAPGITEGRAARIVQGAIRARHDDPGGFLATDRSREIYDAVLAKLRERAVTTYGKQRLATFYPSSVDSRIEEMQAFSREAVTREVDDEMLAPLRDVTPVKRPRDLRVRDRCLATTDAETYTEARDAFPELSVEIVEDTRGLADLARGYSTVVALDEAFAGVEVDGDVQVKPNALEHPEEVIPERTLAFFARNRGSIRAAIRVHEAARLDPDIDTDRLRDALEQLDDDGSVVGDEELDRLSGAIDDLDVAVSTAESIANDRLKEAIQAQDVTIEGADLLSLVERGAGVDSLLSRELADEYDEAVDAAREHLVDAVRLDTGEAEVAERVFQDDPTYPVDRDEDAVSRLREDLVAARDRRAARRKQDIAAMLADLRDDSETLVRDALDLDVELAVARFAEDFDCVLPTREGDGFAIEAGRSPLLDVDYADVEPVDYGVDGVALLSGVNSGGKTSTLDLAAVVVILAHMGLPVPTRRARVPEISELHYYAKSQGTLDAGAFESTLRDFAALTDGADDRLVLVDELESITEPGASAKIIAGILEELHEAGASGVFVSHLAGEIRAAAEFDVPVDGIRAKGLEDGELVVDRSPVKDHLARSTPELIVEKLAGEAQRASKEANSAERSSANSQATKSRDDGASREPGDAETGFYDRLLEKF